MANAWLLAPLPIAAATATSSALGAPGNVATDYAGIVWQSGGGADLVLDLGGDMAVDTVMLFGVDIAPTGATLEVIGATAAAGPTGQSWSGGAVSLYGGVAGTQAGRGVALWQAAAGALPGVRYVRLRFSHATRVARAVVGRRVALARNYSFGASFGVRDLGSVDFSRFGVLMRTRGRKLRTASVTFSAIYRDELEQAVAPMLERLGNTEIVALVTDPSPHTHRQQRCYCGPLVGEVGAVQRRADGFETKLNVVSLF